MEKWSAHWTFQDSAKTIQNSDLICLLQGALNPMIIRLCGDCFAIIMIAATPPENVRTKSGDVEWLELLQSTELFTRDFLLIWDWESFLEKLQDSEKFESLIPKNDSMLEHSKIELEGDLDQATRIWNVALILGDLEDYEKAEERLREARKAYEMVFGEEHPHILESKYGLTRLA